VDVSKLTSSNTFAVGCIVQPHSAPKNEWTDDASGCSGIGIRRMEWTTVDNASV